jgi:tetratricopeptide (TPR) repeat protein
MGNRLLLLTVLLFLGTSSWAQTRPGLDAPGNPTTVIGPRNIPLYDGAQALLAGENQEGIDLTLQGLQIAVGRREEEAALSNLCAGYIKIGNYDEALRYCNILLARNDKNWRGYNNRAVVYIMKEQWDKADSDLNRGEALNPGARTMKIARAMYMDAVHPVQPEVEIDDRQGQDAEDADER